MERITMQLNSEQINEIATALAKAQGMMEAPKKDKKNPHFKNEYASLGSILTACKKALGANGLSVCQQVIEQSDKTILVSTLLHSSGQWMRSYMPLKITPQATPQQMGSALTYARRYSITSLLFVDSDEDDDGELASKPAAPQVQHIQPAKRELLSLELIEDLVSKLTHEDRCAAVEFCKRSFGSEDLRNLPRATYDNMLKRAIAKIEAEVSDEG